MNPEAGRGIRSRQGTSDQRYAGRMRGRAGLLHFPRILRSRHWPPYLLPYCTPCHTVQHNSPPFPQLAIPSRKAREPHHSRRSCTQSQERPTCPAQRTITLAPPPSPRLDGGERLQSKSRSRSRGRDARPRDGEYGRKVTREGRSLALPVVVALPQPLEDAVGWIPAAQVGAKLVAQGPQRAAKARGRRPASVEVRHRLVAPPTRLKSSPSPFRLFPLPNVP